MVSIKYFTSPTCNPCAMFKPIFTETISEMGLYADFINVSQTPDMARTYDVRSVPTIVILKDGQVSGRHTGVMSKPQLQEFIKAYSV